MIKVEIVENKAKYISSAADLPKGLTPEDLYTEIGVQVVNAVIASVLGGTQLLVDEMKKEDEKYGNQAVNEEMIRLFYEVAHKVKLENVMKVYHDSLAEKASGETAPAVEF